MAKSIPPGKHTAAPGHLEPKPVTKTATTPARTAPRAASTLFDSYPAALDYLYARINLEHIRPTSRTRHRYKLDRMKAIMRELGNPQDSIRTIHIAGTKGKGSVCEMTGSCLEACGYTVGLFTSPHLENIRERIRINRALIPEPAFTRELHRAALAARSVAPQYGEPTFFELMTALGFLHFASQAVDLAIIEVGLGGLLDCTNIITPEVAVITMIGLDHTQILGDTVQAIARQKAGICKPGVPTLTFAQSEPIMQALRETARAAGSPLLVLGQDIDFSHRCGTATGGHTTAAHVNLQSPRCNFEHVAVPLPGQHQAFNCALALAVTDQLIRRGLPCPEQKVIEGLARTQLPGRFQIVSRSPAIVLDVAHNPDSIAALLHTLPRNLAFETLITIFGCAADKDAPSMLRALAAGSDKVIFTQAADNARAADPAQLQRTFAEFTDRPALTAPTLAQAIDMALRSAARPDAICITGSFYLVGEALKVLADRKARAAR